MNARDLTALVHLVGFTTGIILYTMLGVMTRRRLAYVSAPSDTARADRVPMLAAVLGIVWNVGALLTYALRDFGNGAPPRWIPVTAYVALGALPAVVVYSALRRAKAAERRFDTSITALALAAFALSAAHLSRHPGLVDQDPWPIELIGHHASLPLVLAILYQDYRFAFADLFLKRALAVLVLMAVVALLYATLAAPLVDPHAVAARLAEGNGSHLFSTAALLGLWVATALAYPLIRREVYRFVDRVVLQRADYRAVRSTVAAELSSAQDVDAALNVVCARLRVALDASAVTWHVVHHRAMSGEPSITVGARRIDACVSIATALEPSFEIRLGELRGGRTLLSDDLVFLDSVASIVGRRIDELRIDAERRARDEHEREARRLLTEAELRALRAQLDPHFLFNALNTLGALMQTAPERAVTTLYRLTGLLRAVLRRSNGPFVSLREELEIVESYLAIEHERFQERLLVEIDVPDDLRHVRVPPLLLQPLAENAVKHGIAPRREGGAVTVRAARDADPVAGDEFLRLLVIDTGRGMDVTATAPREGVGLANIEERLRHYYGAAAAMVIRETPGGGTTVEVCIPWMVATSARMEAGV